MHNNDTPSIWVPVSVFIMCMVAFWLIGVVSTWGMPWEKKRLWLAFGLFVGLCVSAYWSWQLLKHFYAPWKWEQKASETRFGSDSAKAQTLEIDLTIADNEHRWTDCGLYPDEWRKVGAAVHNAKKFTVATFEAAFGQQKGREIYTIIAAPLADPDVGILIEVPKGDSRVEYRISQGRGEYFFEQLATLPFPYPSRPNVMKMVRV